MSIKSFKTSSKAKSNLGDLKSRLGFKEYHPICRWAFCLSLADPTRPKLERFDEGGAELDWETFGQEAAEIYTALLRKRCIQDDVELTDANLLQQFKLHLHRGIRTLMDEVRRPAKSDGGSQGLSDLTNLVLKLSQGKQAG